MLKVGHRLRWALVVALGLHAAVLSRELPKVVAEARKLAEQKKLEGFAVPLTPAPAPLAAPKLQMQTRLSSLKNPPPSRAPVLEALPAWRPTFAEQLDVAESLSDAKDEAGRAAELMARLMAQAQAQAKLDKSFVAEIVLARPGFAPPSASSADRGRTARAPEPAERPRRSRRERQRPAPEPPPPVQVAQVAAPDPEPVRAPPLPEPEPEAEPIFVPTPRADAALPAVREDQPLAALFIPGLDPAPERGAGKRVQTAQEFFSALTAQLLRANQVALANAIRAGRKLTLDVRFYVGRDGRVLGAQVVRPTGREDLDRRAEAVILEASPLPQMPADLPQRRLELSFPVEVYL